jgi:hypothetical protein
MRRPSRPARSWFARDACQAQHWQVCIIELNEAKALDPEGDEDPDVQALRREAHDHP